MMEYSEKVPFSLKFFAVPLKNNLSIRGRITYKRAKAEFSTGIRCENADWDADTGSFNPTKAHSRYLITRIREIEGKLYSTYVEMRQAGSRITASSIKDVYTGKAEAGSPKLIEYFDSYIKLMERKGELSPKTIGIYYVTSRYLIAWLRSQRMKDLRLNELKRAHLMSFKDHMLTTYNKQCKGMISLTTCNKYMQKLKVVINDALAREVIIRNPFTGFKMESEKTSMAFLTIDEIRLITEHDLGGCPYLDQVRRIFLFSVFSGLRFGDAISVLRSQITTTDDGQHWLRIEQQKTKAIISRPLFRPAIEIYEYYKRTQPHMKTVLPYLTNQYVNRVLKEIAAMVGIKNKVVTFHTSRHTHACLLVENGIDLVTISAFMGHASTRSTEIYAKVSSSRMRAVVNDLNDQF
jgi:integrase/recombinase XerD